MVMRDWIVNLMVILGAVLVIYGVMMIYPPAAFVVSGLALIIGAVAIARGDEHRERTR